MKQTFKHHLQRAGAVVVAIAACLAMPVSSWASAPQDGPAELLLVSAPASYLGVNIRDIDEHAAQTLGLKSKQGVEVTAVDHDAPAGKAGIHLRDVIVTVDGKSVTSAQQFRETMRGFPPGKTVNLNILREAKPLKFSIQLADRVKLQQQAFAQHFSVPMPELGNTFSSVVAAQNRLGDENADVDDDAGTLVTRPYRIGAELDAIGPQLAAFFGVKDGTGMLVKTVDADGPAAIAGLQAGDVILKLNDEPVASPFDWMRAMQSVGDKPIQLTIVRNKRVETITVNPPKTQAKVEWPRLSPMPQIEIDSSKLDALRDELKNNPELSKESMQKMLDDARTMTANPADEAMLKDQIKNGLASAGLTPDGKISPDLQKKLDDEMAKAKQQMEMFKDQVHPLQPY